MIEKIVIVGAGQAAGQAAVSLRQQGFAGSIVLVGDEAYLPYQRPPLSKKYLAGDLPAERLFVRPAEFYEDARVELRLQTRVAAIDRQNACVVTADDERIAYYRLILATGSRVRRLPVDGTELKGVFYLRTIADVDAVRAAWSKGGSVVIIGAGYIGLEVAAVARQAGLDVTVVEMADRVMSRVVSPEISDFYQIEHTNHGVRFRLSVGVAAIHGRKRVKSVETTDGETIAADFVVIGVGILPNTELATAAGLEVDDGIVVDDQCRTSDPAIYAAGDCTSHPSAIYGRRLRLESVHNALEQAKTAAANICGEETHYADVPWFWSDQYDLKLQIAGLSAGYDDVVIRGNPAERAFSCLYLREGRLIAVDAINAPRDFVQSKSLIATGRKLAVEQLANPDVALKDMTAPD